MRGRASGALVETRKDVNARTGVAIGVRGGGSYDGEKTDRVGKSYSVRAWRWVPRSQLRGREASQRSPLLVLSFFRKKGRDGREDSNTLTSWIDSSLSPRAAPAFQHLLAAAPSLPPLNSQEQDSPLVRSTVQ